MQQGQVSSSRYAGCPCFCRRRCAHGIPRCRRRRLGFPREHRPVPPLPPRDLRRRHRAGARDGAADAGAAHGQGQPRLPLLRPARLRQDDQRPHPGPLPQLRAGSDPRAVRHLRLVRGARPRRRGHGRRHRDRRGQPRRCRRRPRPARARVLRAGPEPLQDLHHRRGAHGDAAGLQRPAEDRRGAAGAREVRLRDDRAREGHRHDPLPHPPLPVPAGPAAAAPGLHGAAVRVRGRGGGAGRAVVRRPRRRRLGA